MRKFVFGSVMLSAILVMFAFKSADNGQLVAQSTDGNINWMSWDEAIAAAEKEPKKIFVDVYTDWCGWCKRMDKTTFADSKVAKYVNDNFYAVKFNAEQREEVVYRGHTLKYIAAAGRRGVHELAYSLLDGRLGYPSYVYLDEEQNRISISPGFKQVNPFLKELKYIAEDHYKNTRFDDYTGR